jgi:hypothetical protein
MNKCFKNQDGKAVNLRDYGMFVTSGCNTTLGFSNLLVNRHSKLIPFSDEPAAFSYPEV